MSIPEEDEVDENRAAAGGDELADEPIRIVPYDSTWPERFEQERALLEDAIGEWVVEGGLHHVGSTAVPGLAAKPVIDILVGVRSLAESRACFGRLGAIGYVYFPYRTEEMHWFCKPNPNRRTHHLHLIPTDGPRFRDELAFRDYLRLNRESAEEYGALKRELAKKFRSDREGYTEAKGEFISGVLTRSHPSGLA